MLLNKESKTENDGYLLKKQKNQSHCCFSSGTIYIMYMSYMNKVRH